MTPGARVQAAIEVLDRVILSAREGGAAADTLVARYFAERRYAGSKDRRAVRDLVYDAIRRAGEVPKDGRAAMLGLVQDQPELAALFDGVAHGPPCIGGKERAAAAGIAPAWLCAKLAASGIGPAESAALLERAPLDARVNTMATTREAMLTAFPEAVATPFAPAGLRFPAGVALEASEAWQNGLIEIQDEGSQLVAQAGRAAEGTLLVDLCAGGGGKTLALAAAMNNRGRLVACDTDRGRLSQLAPRAHRAGATIVETRLLDPGREASALGDLDGAADLVLIDAPCSGVGTWRRNPESRWRLSPDRLEKLGTLQARLLDIAAPLVKPGGAIVYIVCSLLDEEGANQISSFLERSPGWRSDDLRLPAGTAHGMGVRLTPLADSTDGFFVARLERPC